MFQLFPKQMPALVRFIDGYCRSVIEDQLNIHQSQKRSAQELSHRISRFGERLCHGRYQFARQLFGDHHAAFTIDCLNTYVTVIRHEDSAFVMAVTLFFGKAT